MKYTKQASLLMSLAAIAAMGSVLPAQANPTTIEETTIEETTAATDEAAAIASEATLLLPAEAESTAVVLDDSWMAFDTEAIDVALESGTVEAAPEVGTDLLAQSSGYQGVSPAYLGVGGNIGIGDDSPISDFGFAVISKISLGPRFALRPGAIIAEKGISFPVPITYNFNVIEFGGFNMQPYVGAGVDIPTDGGVGLLLDAGIDVPISRDFTVNATTNWRLTDGFGFGLVVGVAYNFPWIFE